MYADDLILVTRGNRLVARNIKRCINIYTNLTGQRPNLAKSQIFFPSLFNKKSSEKHLFYP